MAGPASASPPGRWRRLSHEIGTPLNAVSGHLEVLLDGSLGPLAPEVRRSLHEVQAAVRQVRRQSSLLLSLVDARSEPPGEAEQPVPLGDLFQRAWQAHDGWRRGELRLTIPAGLSVLAEPDTLGAIAALVVDLYRGAGEAGGPPGGPAPLQVGFHAGTSLRVAWTGLEPADLPAIELALLEALMRRQGGVLEPAAGHLDLRWPLARLAGRAGPSAEAAIPGPTGG